MRKRVLSLLLALALCVGLAVPAWAASDEAVTAADRLNGLGLFNGVGNNADGTPNYDLDRAPTRMEAVTLLVRLLGKGAEAEAGNWTTPFTDVADWAKPYVGYAYANDLTAGTSATTFSGSDTVSAAQYLTFVLRALGYSSSGDFAWDAAWELTDKLGITAGQYGATSAFTRGDAVLVSANALDVKLKDGSKTLLEAIEEALANAPEAPEAPADSVNAGKTFTTTGNATVRRADGGEDTHPIRSKLDVVSAHEAIFTLEFDFSPEATSEFIVLFIIDGKYYVFHHDSGGSYYATRSESGQDIRMEDVTFSDTKEEHGLVTWRVNLPDTCPFHFDMVSENNMWVETVVNYGL